MKNIAVIGAQYGDESKGREVAALSKRSYDVIVRFNGGAQAGHTVHTKSGDSHIFSHFGSSFEAPITVLGPRFVVHPENYLNEWDSLKRIHTPVVFFHADSYVTTPLDVIYNRRIENSRAKKRHGSVGLGFHETIKRCETNRGAHSLTIRDIKNGSYNKKDIVDYYIDIEAEYQHTHSSHPADQDIQSLKEKLNLTRRLAFNEIFDEFADKVLNRFASHINIISPTHNAHLLNSKSVIFEGAQGLSLDQNSEDFPHVTHSHTGSENIIELYEMYGIKNPIEFRYMTRSYTTRHGAGPLPFEAPMPLHIVDTTNIHNMWQGTLRYSPLNIDRLSKNIFKDRINHKQFSSMGVKTDCRLVISCLDQINKNAIVVYRNEKNRVDNIDECEYLQGIEGISRIHTRYSKYSY